MQGTVEKKTGGSSPVEFVEFLISNTTHVLHNRLLIYFRSSLSSSRNFLFTVLENQ